jgi:hypothetical protein
LVFVAVTLVGGTGCIGAYLVAPVCIVYVGSNCAASGAGGFASPAFAVLSCVGGPAVPLILASAGLMFAGKTAAPAAMPEYEKRSEYVMSWPPVLPTATIFKKLQEGT